MELGARDISQALRDTENGLRDFIAQVLSERLGADWTTQCGVPPERIEKWKQRKQDEEHRQEAGTVDERLIYYADFYDLKTVLHKNWAHFAEALGDWKTMEVYLGELEKLRDPEAHRRELLPHQKHLALGIEGEVRGRIIRWRSKKETPADYFPRIESARDSLSHIWVPGSGRGPVFTGATVRAGDCIDFALTARDPDEAPLEYRAGIWVDQRTPWQSSPEFHLCFDASHIGANVSVSVQMRSNRTYHAWHEFDDEVQFYYSVLPGRVV